MQTVLRLELDLYGKREIILGTPFYHCAKAYLTSDDWYHRGSTCGITVKYF